MAVAFATAIVSLKGFKYYSYGTLGTLAQAIAHRVFACVSRLLAAIVMTVISVIEKSLLCAIPYSIMFRTSDKSR